MKKLYLILSSLVISCSLLAQDNNYTHGLSIWFNNPTSLKGKEIWYKNHPKESNSKPVTAGDTTYNPDREWESQSLPLGNGSIGANIFGSVNTERFTFNEKTLWRGGPNTSKGAQYYWNTNKQSAKYLPLIRKAFEEGNDKLAAELTRKNFNGYAGYSYNSEKPFRFGNYTTAGEFTIETGINEKEINSYQRVLSLDSALAVVQFNHLNTKYQRKFFVSYPNQVMVVKFSANKGKKQNLKFSYSPNPVSTGHFETAKNNMISYKAALDNNNMKYVIRIYAKQKGGKLTIVDNSFVTKGSDEVTFIIAADTDYKQNLNPDFNDPKTYVGVNPEKATLKHIKNAKRKSYNSLFQKHYKDYANLFNRVKLNLYAKDKVEIPTSQRLEEYRNGKEDKKLEELYYQFGRYLLIASSRPGNLPANLQGMWHNNVDGPWRMDYHTNINVQMNYWPSCSTNLYECMVPFINFIRSLEKPGKRTAKSYFNARGWTASISANIFGFTSPLSSEDMSWNFGPMAGPWLSTHIWEYYDYTRDKKFLKEVGYPLIKGSADFAVDYLWKKKDGTYTAAPSTSPEHGPIDQGATFVHAVIRDILGDAIKAAKTLNIDSQERKEWQNVLDKLAPYEIGRYGQLMEWSKDIDDPNDHHRHVNHLYGLHPGKTISPITTPKLAEASRIVLEHRGDLATGWSMGWKLNQWARLHDGNHAYKLFQNLLKNGTLDNLWDTHPPFQIDGNFGGIAGVTEMLMQSHLGFIHLLPALPDKWANGSISGLCARGNFVINLEWKNNTIDKVIIYSRKGEYCKLRYKDLTLNFSTKKGKQYIITYQDNKLNLLK